MAPQRLLTRRGVARTGAGRAERCLEAVGDLGRRQQSAAGRRQLDRQRQPVDAPADLSDRGSVAVAEVKAGVVGSRALAEQRDSVGVSQFSRTMGCPGLGQRERRHRIALLGLHSERFATGGQDGERRTGLEQPGDEWRGFE